MRLIIIFAVMVLINAMTSPEIADALLAAHPEQARQTVGMGLGLSFLIGLAGMPTLKEVLEGPGWLIRAVGINIVLVITALIAGAIGRFGVYLLTTN